MISKSQKLPRHVLSSGHASPIIILIWYRRRKRGKNKLPGASLPLILLRWVIFKSSFSKHLLSPGHWELLFHMLCLYCGCGRSGAEPACFQQTSGSYMVHHAKFKISNKFNMYSVGIRCLLPSAKCSDSLSWGLSGRPQSGPI